MWSLRFIHVYMYILRIIHNIAGLTSSQGVCCLLNHSSSHATLRLAAPSTPQRAASSQGKRIDSLINKWKKKTEKIVVNLLDFHMFYPGLECFKKWPDMARLGSYDKVWLWAYWLAKHQAKGSAVHWSAKFGLMVIDGCKCRHPPQVCCSWQLPSIC